MNLKHLLLFTLVLLVACTPQKKQNNKNVAEKNRQEIPVNTISLFDGETLDGWEITSFGTEGPVLVSGGKIIINMGDGCSGITKTGKFPAMNYEVGLEAQKTRGNDFFCGLTFPVDDDFCSFIVGGWGGPVVGLSIIDGLDASENETKTLMNFEKNTWYKIRLQVTDDKIMGWIDDKKVVDFPYQNRKLGIRPEVSLSKPFGVCTWMTTAEIRNFWLRELSD